MKTELEILTHRIKSFDSILKMDGVHISKIYNAEMDMLDALVAVLKEKDIWRVEE